MQWVDVLVGDERLRMSKYPVTNRQYERCIRAGKCESPTRSAHLPLTYKYDEKEPTVMALLPCGCVSNKYHSSKYCRLSRLPYDTWNRKGYEDFPVTCVTQAQAETYSRWIGGSLPTDREWTAASRLRSAFVMSHKGPRKVKVNNSFESGMSNIGNVYEWTRSHFNFSSVVPREWLIRGGSWVSSNIEPWTSTASAHADKAYHWLGFRPVIHQNRSKEHRSQALIRHSPVLPLTPVFQPYMRKYKHRLYRIPGIVRLLSGVLIVVAEGRVNDHDYKTISIVVRRSVDDGKHWLAEQTVAALQGWCYNTPTLLVDSTTQQIHLFYSVSRVGFHNLPGARLRRITSDDSGETWSNGVDLQMAAKAGPGHGLQLQFGPHKGRLVMPLRTRDKGFKTIISDNGGQDWRPSSGLSYGNEVQLFQSSNGAIGAVMRGNCLDIARPKRLRLSDDGSVSWRMSTLPLASGPFPMTETLTACSLLTIPIASPFGDAHILYSCPAMAAKHCRDHTARRQLTVRMSLDDGKSWPFALLLEHGLSAYSDLAADWSYVTQPQDVKVYAVFERGEDRYDEEVVFTSFLLRQLYDSPVQ